MKTTQQAMIIRQANRLLNDANSVYRIWETEQGAMLGDITVCYAGEPIEIGELVEYVEQLIEDERDARGE